MIGKNDEGPWKGTVEGIKENLPDLEDMILMATEIDSPAKPKVTDSRNLPRSGGDYECHLNGM